MSDLYLVLRSRLEAVTNWVQLGSDVMATARNRRGLSYEAVARLANVSAKTYERYEKRGRVPEHMVGTFADVLGLEIVRPALVTVSLEDGETDVAALRREVQSLERKVDAGLDEILRRLPEQDQPLAKTP